MKRLSLLLPLLFLVSACGSSADAADFEISEITEFWLVTDCESVEPEQFCGEILEFRPDGRGGHLAGGDVFYEATWELRDGYVVVDSSAVGELVFSYDGDVLTGVGTDRVFAP